MENKSNLLRNFKMIKEIKILTKTLKDEVNTLYTVGKENPIVNDIGQVRTILKKLLKSIQTDSLSHTDEVICIAAIFNFLNISDIQDVNIDNFNDSISFASMKSILNKYNTDMTEFTEYLNFKYEIVDGPLWKELAQEFFSDRYKTNKFYTTVLTKIYQ